MYIPGCSYMNLAISVYLRMASQTQQDSCLQLVLPNLANPAILTDLWVTPQWTVPQNLKVKRTFFFFFFSPSDGPCLFPQWSSWGKDSLQRTIQGCPGSPVLNGSCSRAEIVSPGSPINSKQGIYWQRWGSTGITLQECSTSWSFMNGIYLHICYVFVTFPNSLSYPLPVIAQQT